MKGRTSLSLMELVIMLLVFSLAAALTLRAFAAADRISGENEIRDEAVILAQTVGETVKHTAGPNEEAARLLGGLWQGGTLTVTTAEGLTASVTPIDSGTPLLGCALVEVFSPGEEPVFSLTVCWQEVDGHE